LKQKRRDRDEYLKRPGLGRRLSEYARERLAHPRREYDAAFVIADGLSAPAVQRHAEPLLDILLRR
jgi:ethanolamine ammonia-lyase small subunit